MNEVKHYNITREEVIVEGSVPNNMDWKDQIVFDFCNKLSDIRHLWKKGLQMYNIFRDHYGEKVLISHQPKLVTDLQEPICEHIGEDISFLFGAGEFPFFNTYQENNVIYYQIVR